MKAVVIGAVVAVVIAFGASQVLDLEVQKDAARAYQTEGVRL